MSLRCVIVEDQTMFRQMMHGMRYAIPELEVVATATTESEGLTACRTRSERGLT